MYTSYIYVYLAHQFDGNKDGQLNRTEFEAMLTTATDQARKEAAKQAEMAASASVPLS